MTNRQTFRWTKTARSHCPGDSQALSTGLLPEATAHLPSPSVPHVPHRLASHHQTARARKPLCLTGVATQNPTARRFSQEHNSLGMNTIADTKPLLYVHPHGRGRWREMLAPIDFFATVGVSASLHNAHPLVGWCPKHRHGPQHRKDAAEEGRSARPRRMSPTPFFVATHRQG